MLEVRCALDGDRLRPLKCALPEKPPKGRPAGADVEDVLSDPELGHVLRHEPAAFAFKVGRLERWAKASSPKRKKFSIC